MKGLFLGKEIICAALQRVMPLFFVEIVWEQVCHIVATSLGFFVYILGYFFKGIFTHSQRHC